MTKTVFKFLAVVPPGIEDVTLGEVKSLFNSGKKVRGGVEFSGDISTLMKANLYLRTPTRILLTVGRFKAKDFKSLVQRTARYPWEIYCPKGIPLKIRVTSSHSRLWHTDAVKERLLKGIEGRLGFSPTLCPKGEVQDHDQYQLVVCRLKNDICTLEVDTSGDFLFKRGYKVTKGLAPLRENLAAALILASGWDKDSPLLDPFCGTGTIPIEAALMLRNIPPGAKRTFPFFRWRIFDARLWEDILYGALEGVRREEMSPIIFARDRDPAMVKATCENAKRAGVLEDISVERLSFETSAPPSNRPGWIVTNLPYGERLKEGGESAFLKTIKEHIGKNYRGWKVFCLFPTAQTRPTRRAKEVLRFFHGGIKVSLLRLS